MEAEKAPDLHGPPEGHRTATGSCPDGAIAKLVSVTLFTGVR